MGARLSPQLIQKSQEILKLALKEDAAANDITSKTFIARNQKATAILIAKQAGIWCGDALIANIKIPVSKKIRDGQKFKPGQVLLTLSGNLQAILGLERSLLNLLQHLCGVSTLTAQFVQKAGKTKILDTRKTTPGLRMLERYAVEIGGGHNHRFNLQSAFLIKENHLARLSRPLSVLIAKIKNSGKPIIIEAETLDQVKTFLKLPANRILLDNFSPAQINQAQKIRKALKSKIPFEVSGGVTLKTISKYARLHPEFISIGTITHSAPSIDLSLRIKPQ